MKALLDRLHAKLGDLWWYSLMIFVACRSGDVIQAFIGLWLVPKYVGPEELGAVLPLQQLCNLFAVPLTALAIVFAKYVNVYATRGELGKVKSFIQDALIVAVFFFLICIITAVVVIPHFYERLNVTSGLLTALILACGFISNIAQLLSGAIKGLKLFKVMTLVHLLGAPLRLVTLLVTMPIRALSGYILGQTSTPALESFISFLALRRRLASIPSDTSWRGDMPQIVRYFVPVLILTCGGLFNALIMTVYRQRLPEVESGAFYLLSRFSDIAAYAGASLIVVIFPLAAEAHEKGHENLRVLRHSLLGTAIAALILACIFFFSCSPILSITEMWAPYKPYATLLPLLTLTTGLSTMAGIVYTYEIACARFSYGAFTFIVNGLWAASLVCISGVEFFRGVLPDTFIDSVASLNLVNLTSFSWIAFGVAAIQLLPLPRLLKPRA